MADKKKTGKKQKIVKKVKNTETDDLISALVEDSTPVKPVPKSGFLCTAWVIFATAFFVLAVVRTGLRHDIDDFMNNPVLLVQATSLILAGVAAALATFRLAVPQERIPPVTWVLTGFATLVIMGLLVHCGMNAVAPDFEKYMNPHMIWHRVKTLLLFCIVPTIVMVWMVRRAAPVHTALAGYTSFLAVTCLAVAGCRMTCPIDSFAGNLMWHFAPIVILSLLGYVAGRLFYRW